MRPSAFLFLLIPGLAAACPVLGPSTDCGPGARLAVRYLPGGDDAYAHAMRLDLTARGRLLAAPWGELGAYGAVRASDRRSPEPPRARFQWQTQARDADHGFQAVALEAGATGRLDVGQGWRFPARLGVAVRPSEDNASYALAALRPADRALFDSPSSLIRTGVGVRATKGRFTGAVDLGLDLPLGDDEVLDRPVWAATLGLRLHAADWLGLRAEWSTAAPLTSPDPVPASRHFSNDGLSAFALSARVGQPSLAGTASLLLTEADDPGLGLALEAGW